MRGHITFPELKWHYCESVNIIWETSF